MQVGIIGTGNMGTILVEGLLTANAVSEEKLVITNRTPDKAKHLQAKFPLIQFLLDKQKLVERCDLIFICTKQQDYAPLLKEIRPWITEEKCIVSITSAISTDLLENVLPASCIRVIPSITNRSLSGICLVTYGKNCSSIWKEKVNKLIGKIGTPVEIDDQYVRVASDIVSCGPAFFSFILEKFIDAAVKKTQISPELTTKLASQMFIGMGALLEGNYYTLETLKKKVMVKGGITGEGIKAMENSDIEAIFENLFEATHKKFENDLAEVAHQFKELKS